MKDTRIARDSLVLLGCGKMGSAMLEGWLERGLPPASVWVQDPGPSEWLQQQGVHLNEHLPENPAIVLVAVKPQMMAEALPTLRTMGNGETLFVSVAAGTPITFFEATLGQDTPVVRAMPNTPAAIGQGITAIVANAHAGPAGLDEAEALLSAVGAVVRLSEEAQIDAVTGVSGSGPAYVFHMIETMAEAGVAEGLPPALAMQLAKATVAGAGALALQSGEDPAQLRINVTSPNGTTQAALEVLMDEAGGFPALLSRAVAAAADRSRELSRG
ncbi:pyrroline-5-carboxylate reductase [Sulfitobacter sp. S190]|uniref:pyrroline-5-carboxylate reductase n=1 Tax=Sulfitobacter sp. S190 TaxID=2867022 RepID=UPI0021A271CD|nr:pyrroline-5-carboxylate reductase [Sulfitobacter sp. S190]UWR23160.1 pyrroline-5-carboxylate reductase [Sulfitobacter sp. S190]